MDEIYHFNILQNNTFSGLFIGQNLVSLKRVDSTNDYLKNHLTKSTPLPEGTVILAGEQTAGRGQLDNKWLSQPGKNLTFSILLSPVFLPLKYQFLLNVAISLAINDILTSFIGFDCKIKWPNDIYYKDNKIGGVLIENIVRGSEWRYAIVGVGLNINQTNFPESIKNITSLSAITGRYFVLNEILSGLCGAMNKRYQQLKDGGLGLLLSEYKEKLFRFNVLKKFESDGITFEGKIIDVDLQGKISVDDGNEIRFFALKEIKYIFD